MVLKYFRRRYPSNFVVDVSAFVVACSIAGIEEERGEGADRVDPITESVSGKKKKVQGIGTNECYSARKHHTSTRIFTSLWYKVGCLSMGMTCKGCSPL